MEKSVSQNWTPPPAKTLNCRICGKIYVCDPGGNCWCKALSFKLPVPPTITTCYCPCEMARLESEAHRE